MDLIIYELYGARIEKDNPGAMKIDALGKFFNRAAAEKEKQNYEKSNELFDMAYKTFWVEEIYEPTK